MHRDSQRMLSSRHTSPTPSSSDPPAPASGGQSSWKRSLSWKDEERKTKKEETRAALRDEMRSITINPVSELIRSGGKPYRTPDSLAHPMNAQVVPPGALQATLLDDHPVHLPGHCAQFGATFLVVGFNQQAMEFGERWTADLATMYPQDGSQKDVRCLQLSIHGNSLISTLFGSYLTRRLQSATPDAKRSYTALLKENPFDPTRVRSTFVPAAKESSSAPPMPGVKGSAAAAPTRSALAAEPGWSVQNSMLTHLFLLDKAGRIRWRAVGPPVDADLSIARRVVKQLVDEQNAAEQEAAFRAASKGAGKAETMSSDFVSVSMAEPADTTAAATTALAAATLEDSALAAAPAAPAAAAAAAPFALGSFSPPPASAPFFSSFGAASFASPAAASPFNFGAAVPSSASSAPNPFAAATFVPSADAAAAPFAFSAGSFLSAPSAAVPSRSSHGGKQRRSPAKPHSSSVSAVAAYDPNDWEDRFDPRPAPPDKQRLTDLNEALKSTAITTIRPTNFAKRADMAAAWAKNQMERTMDQTNAKQIAAQAELAAQEAAVAAASGSVASASSSSGAVAATPAAAVYSLLNVGHTDAWLAEREMWDQQDASLPADSSTAAQIRGLLNELNVASVLASIIVSFVEPPYSSLFSGFLCENKYSLHAIPQMAVPASSTLVAAAVDVISTHLAQVQLCLRELAQADERAYDVTMALEQARCDNHVHKERCSSCAASPIRGLLWRCEACPSFHLCNSCCQAGAEPQHHLRSHPLIRITGTAFVATVAPAAGVAAEAATPVIPAAAAAAASSVVSLDASEGSAAPSSPSCAPSPESALLRAPPKTVLSELSVCWHHPQRGQFAASLSGWRSIRVFDIIVSHTPRSYDWVTERSSASERAWKARADAELLLANPPIPPAVLLQHAAVLRAALHRNYRRRVLCGVDDSADRSQAEVEQACEARSNEFSAATHQSGVTVRSAVIFYTRTPQAQRDDNK